MCIQMQTFQYIFGGIANPIQRTYRYAAEQSSEQDFETSKLFGAFTCIQVMLTCGQVMVRNYQVLLFKPS